MVKSAAAGGKNPVRLAKAGWRESSTNPRALSALPRTCSSEMLRYARKSAVLRRRMDRSKLIQWRGGFGDPTALGSWFGSGSACDLVIPFAVEGPGPRAGNGSVYHGPETSFFQERAHVNVNQE